MGKTPSYNVKLALKKFGRAMCSINSIFDILPFTMTVPAHIENLEAREKNRAKAALRFLQKIRKNRSYQESKLKDTAVVSTSVELLHLKLAKINIDMENKK